MMRHALALPAAIAVIALATSATAQGASDVEDLVGARAAGGETQLLSRGYEQRQSNDVRDQRFTFWWNKRTGRCISVSTMEGRYAAIIGVPAGNCSEGSQGVYRTSRLTIDFIIFIFQINFSIPTFTPTLPVCWVKNNHSSNPKMHRRIGQN